MASVLFSFQGAKDKQKGGYTPQKKQAIVNPHPSSNFFSKIRLLIINALRIWCFFVYIWRKCYLCNEPRPHYIMKTVRYVLFNRDRDEFLLTQRAGDLAEYFGISLGHMRRKLYGVGVLEYRGCVIWRDVDVGRCRHVGREFG